ncbi:LuxR C-terminal-related transcriptional regulator [Chitinophaga sp. CB10]|uniref:LuxR C-terminal-related transcriptional regulator n=1 Tax=Chitinophaga sp. CB10 TaxID=1891659 RepID=UPI0025C3C655|nr:LuxR C-terminal-related transcriptional regulator [Chitinophaga sp. CB10]
MSGVTLEEKLKALQTIEDELPAVLIVHSFPDGGVVHMSARGCRELGYTLEEIRAMGQEYYTRCFNPHDVEDYLPRIMELVNAPVTAAKEVSFFQQVRLAEKDDWEWHLSTTKVLCRDAEGKPTHLITCAIPIDPLHHVTSKLDRLLKENQFLRQHQHIFSELTKREREILRLTALGYSAGEMARELHISEKTVVTHRRNIKSKINAESMYDLTKFAQAFDLI